MKKNNMMALLSIVISIISLLVSILWPDGSTLMIGCSICIILAIASIIFGFIGRKQIKKSSEKGSSLALAGIIVSFIIIVWTSLALFGFMAMKDISYTDVALCPMDNYVNDCVDNGDGTSTCMYAKVYEIPCSTNVLKDNQFKK